MSAISRVDALKKTITYIFSGEVSGQSLTSIYPLGTGFFVAVPHLQVEGRSWIYLVTAKHVLRSNSEEYYRQVFCRANLRDWNPASDRVGVEFIQVSTSGTEGNLLWVVHSNPAVDIAVIQQYPRPDRYDFQTISTAAFVTQEIIQRDGIVEGQELFFPCFTPEIPQHRRNNPIIRFGRISLLSTEDFETREGSVRFHLAECFPFGGNSGSPVFVRATEERYGLFGIMTGYYRTTQPAIQATQSGLVTPQHMGIATIVPIDHLTDILFSNALRRSRGEIS
jgi:hypothetical protein